MIPAQRIINHYKTDLSLESFRRRLETLHLRIKKLPKVTKVAKSEKRKEYLLKVAGYFGITEKTPFDGVFFLKRYRHKMCVNGNISTTATTH
jgi:hypothetical protein